MHTTLTLTKSAIKMFARNRQALFFTLFMPLIIMLIFGAIGFDRVPKIDVGIVAANPSPATQQFIDQLKQITAFNIHQGAEADERDALNKGDRAIVMIIPDNLIPAGQEKPKTQTITLIKNVSQEQQAQTAISVINQILDKTTLAYAQAPELFSLSVESINGKNVRYIDFLLPGIVAMSIMQMAVFSVAFVFVDYKEKGILKRLLATPMKPYQFVTSNVVTRLLVALVQVAVLIAVGVLFFKTHVAGSYLLIFIIALLGSVMFLGLGFSISGIAKTVDAVPAIANLVVFPMLFLSGVFFPTNAMPQWLQNVVQYLPLSHFAKALREVMVDGAGMRQISTELYWILGWAVGLLILAIFSFRFEEKRV